MPKQTPNPETAVRIGSVVTTQSVTAIKLNLVGAGRARDDGAITLQSLCKYRGRGPLLRRVDVLNLRASSQAPAWESSTGSSSFPARKAGALFTGFPSGSLGTSVK